MIQENNDTVVACTNPGSYLAAMLQQEEGPLKWRQITLMSLEIASTRTVTGTTINERSRTLDASEVHFNGPEQSIDNENRVVELNPSFQANCYQ